MALHKSLPDARRVVTRLRRALPPCSRHDGRYGIREEREVASEANNGDASCGGDVASRLNVSLVLRIERAMTKVLFFMG